MYKVKARHTPVSSELVVATPFLIHSFLFLRNCKQLQHLHQSLSLSPEIFKMVAITKILLATLSAGVVVAREGKMTWYKPVRGSL